MMMMMMTMMAVVDYSISNRQRNKKLFSLDTHKCKKFTADKIPKN